MEARAGPTFPLNRHTFVFDTPLITLYQTPLVGFEGALGLAFTP